MTRKGNCTNTHGYARDEREAAILAEAGVPVARIWLEGRGAECLQRLHMRPGEVLATAGGLRPLGATLTDVLREAARIQGCGAVILDVLTGQRLDQHGATMVEAVRRRIKAEKIMPRGKPQAMQTASVAVRVAGRMPDVEALPIWRNPRLTNVEAIARMPGWTTRTAYNRLGERGLPTGRVGKRFGK